MNCSTLSRALDPRKRAPRGSISVLSRTDPRSGRNEPPETQFESLQPRRHLENDFRSADEVEPGKFASFQGSRERRNPVIYRLLGTRKHRQLIISELLRPRERRNLVICELLRPQERRRHVKYHKIAADGLQAPDPHELLGPSGRRSLVIYELQVAETHVLMIQCRIHRDFTSPASLLGPKLRKHSCF